MHKRYPILVIDDDPSVLDVLTLAAGNDFTEAQFIGIHTLAEAATYLEGLRGPGPYLVLLDINLDGELSGFDLLTRLRAHPQGQYVPIIVLSADENPACIREACQRGARAFTAKPESYADWKEYVRLLRDYWCQTVTVPRLWFDASFDQQAELVN